MATEDDLVKVPGYLGECDCCTAGVLDPDAGDPLGGTMCDCGMAELPDGTELRTAVVYQPGGPGGKILIKVCEECYMLGAQIGRAHV